MMKIVVSRFRKRDTTSFTDLTYMDHLLTRRLVNLPRLMMRHMAYVIFVENHELPYGDWLTMVFEAFNVPLIDKQGEEPKRYDFFEDTFLNMCQLKRSKEFGGLRLVAFEGEMMKMRFQLKMIRMRKLQKRDRIKRILTEKFYDVEDEVQGSANMVDKVPKVPTPVPKQQKETTTAGVDPSIPNGSIPILCSFHFRLNLNVPEQTEFK
ncbi:hypothetical protein Dimus_023902 [Dionaea muscipula]